MGLPRHTLALGLKTASPQATPLPRGDSAHNIRVTVWWALLRLLPGWEAAPSSVSSQDRGGRLSGAPPTRALIPLQGSSPPPRLPKAPLLTTTWGGLARGGGERTQFMHSTQEG